MDKDFQLEKRPYLYTSPYLFEELLVLGYTEIQKKRELLPHLIKLLPEKTSEFMSKNTANNCPSLENQLMPSVLHTVSLRESKSEKPSSVLSIVFPQAPKVYYQINQNRNKYDYSVVFFYDFNSTDVKVKNITYGFAYVFYEFITQSPTSFFLVPKVYCFLSKYPFFSHYSQLADHIQQTFLNVTPPIEIVLYHIINYSICPLKSEIAYISMPANFYRTTPQITFNQISGYPICDFNISELFNILPLELMIKVFVLTFLERDVIFFSKNIELLNITLYFFSCIHYPLTDSTYTQYVYSISKGVYQGKKQDDSSQIMKSKDVLLFGINSEFNESIVCPGKDPQFLVDLDNQRMSMFLSENSRENENMRQFCHFIEASIYQRNPSGQKLEENLFMLYRQLETISKKIIRNAESKNEQFVPSFFKLIEGNYQRSKQIQEAFYCFILNAIKPLYSLMYLDKDKLQQPPSHESYFVKLGQPFANEELLFYIRFMGSNRYSTFFENFLFRYEVMDIYAVSSFCFEEFLMYNHSFEQEYSIQHFEIIDELFKGEEKTTVSVLNYALFDPRNKANDYYVLSRLRPTRVMKNELDQFLSFQYSNLVNDLRTEAKDALVPSLKLIQGQEVRIISHLAIAEHIEQSMFFYKEFNEEDLFVFSITNISSLIIPLLSIQEFIALFKVIHEIFRRKRKFLRKNITMLLLVLYHTSLQFKQSLKDFSHFISAYKLLLSILIDNQVYPNAIIYRLFLKFKEIQSHSLGCKYQAEAIFKEEMKDSTCAKTTSEVNHTVPLNSVNADYQLTLFDNSCSDNDRKSDYIYKNAYQAHFDTDIAFFCSKCNKKFTPKLKLTHYNKELLQSEIYPPLKIYKTSSMQMKDWMERNFDLSIPLKLEQMQKFYVNLLFYQPLLRSTKLLFIIKGLFNNK